MIDKVPTNEIIDITPTPRILRTLGDIPFAPWQCLAELVDNSLDAFADAENKGITISAPRIDIHWSSESVRAKHREIIVEDNGPGMELHVLQKAAKAGYSSNDPIHNLGLFGMGFNIATARLGDETIFLSATSESEEWVGIKISFEQLIKDHSFSAPIVRVPKKTKSEAGTKIIVRNMKEGVLAELPKKESSIRKQLETIYTSILSKKQIGVFVQGKQLSPRPHCLWGDSRFVIKKGCKVHAVQYINRDLGDTYFDISRNRYLTEEEIIPLEIASSKGDFLPDYVVRRSRRLKGWIGIQRFADLTTFGIDFIRNGRKILISDKSIFGYENPDTSTFIPEYPTELGSTVGGRIVGELHVDYLIPNYQKNGFDTSDRAWRLTIEALRGAGPILQKKRQGLGYDGDNDSPIGKLVNAYRRVDAGTKNLAINNNVSKELTKHYFEGALDYQSDEKWYRIAQESDRERGEGAEGLSPVNIGESLSEDLSLYLPIESEGEQNNNTTPSKHNRSQHSSHGLPTITSTTSTRDQLIQFSEKEETLSGKYAYGTSPGLDITAWRLRSGAIKIEGRRLPTHLIQDGVEVDFFYDQTHPIILEYPLSPKQLLLQGLAEKFALRDRGISNQTVFLGLVDNHLSEERINPQALHERAYSLAANIREKLPDLLCHRFADVKKIIQEVEAEEEELAKRLLEEAPYLLQAYQCSDEKAAQALGFVCDATIKRLIAQLPEEFLDNKLFAQPFINLKIGTQSAQKRLRKNSLERILTYFSDIILLLQGGRAQQSKHELLRHANTLSILEGLLC